MTSADARDARAERGERALGGVGERRERARHSIQRVADARCARDGAPRARRTGRWAGRSPPFRCGRALDFIGMSAQSPSAQMFVAAALDLERAVDGDLAGLEWQFEVHRHAACTAGAGVLPIVATMVRVPITLARGGHEVGAGGGRRRRSPAGPRCRGAASVCAGRSRAERRRQFGEHTVRHLDHDDPDLRAVDVLVVLERAFDELGHLADRLDPGEAGADHGEGERLLLDLGQLGDLGVLQLLDHVRTQQPGVLQRLQRHRMLGQASDHRQVARLAEREHQVVVRHHCGSALHTLEQRDFALFEVHAVHHRLAHEHVLQQEAQRCGRVGRGHLAGRDLGQQRLKHEVVFRVDQLDLGVVAQPASQVARGEHAGEAAAQDHDTWDHDTGFIGHEHPFVGLRQGGPAGVLAGHERSSFGLHTVPVDARLQNSIKPL